MRIVISYWEAFTDISEDNWPVLVSKRPHLGTNKSCFVKNIYFLIQKIMFSGWSSCHLTWCIWWYIFSWWHEQQPYNIEQGVEQLVKILNKEFTIVLSAHIHFSDLQFYWEILWGIVLWAQFNLYSFIFLIKIIAKAILWIMKNIKDN